ncbi:MAG TPA: hypothetical protein PLJ38_12760 [bacterium]|nr:hypothetical protein [bacterium]
MGDNCIKNVAEVSNNIKASPMWGKKVLMEILKYLFGVNINDLTDSELQISAILFLIEILKK